jgi:hypothetical protein
LRHSRSRDKFTDTQLRSILACAVEASVEHQRKREVEYTRDEVLGAGAELGVQRELVEAAILVSDIGPAETAKAPAPRRASLTTFAVLSCGIALGAGATAIFHRARRGDADERRIPASDDRADNLPISDDDIKRQLRQFIVRFRGATGDVETDRRALETTLDRVDGAARRTIFAHAIANNPATPKSGTTVAVESIARVIAPTNTRWLLTWTEKTADTFGLSQRASRWAATCHIKRGSASQQSVPGEIAIVLDQFQWAPAQ